MPSQLYRCLAIMAFFFTSVLGFAQERAYSYQLGDLLISYRVPKELQAAYTRANDSFVRDDDRMIYTTAFISRGMFTEKSIGHFGLTVIPIPEDLGQNHSLAKLGEYFGAKLQNEREKLNVGTYKSPRGEWLKIETHPKEDITSIGGVLFYRVISDKSILFAGLDTPKGQSWPPSLLKKLLPAVQKVVDSIECTSAAAATPAK